MAGHTLLVGTRKGLFVLDSDDRRTWLLAGPAFAGWEVFDVAVDRRDGTWFAGVNSLVHGPIVARSTDGGRTWDHSGDGLSYGPGGPEITAVWKVAPGHPDRPGEVYAGVEPAGLFRSTDGGRTWTHVEALRDHPTAPDWSPGKGGLCLHTVLVDPDDAERLWVAISAVGVFRSEDGGATWQARNVGVPSVYGEDREAGHCPHKVTLAAGSGDRLYRQDHMGQFASADGGDTWTSIENGTSSGFGFPVVAHPRDPDTLWLLPLVGSSERYVPDGRPAVYRTRDGGRSFERCDRGLPEEAWILVLRDAMTVDTADPVGVAFGTSTGQVFASLDEGDTWSLAANLLPPVLSLAAP